MSENTRKRGSKDHGFKRRGNRQSRGENKNEGKGGQKGGKGNGRRGGGGGRQRPTHFVTVPMNTPENIAKFLELKETLLNEYDLADHGVEESVFISERKIHFTLFVLQLQDEESIKKASKVMSESLKAFKAFQLSCDELGCFPSREKANNCGVFYACPTRGSVSWGNLAAVMNTISEAFYKNGLMTEEQLRKINPAEDKINFHSTIMNARYRKGPKKNKRLFNVEDILCRHEAGDLKFSYSDNNVSSVYLSSMSKASNKITGFYHNEVEVNLVE